MLNRLYAAATKTELPKLLKDSPLCDVLNEQVEIECVRHEKTADRATTKPISSIENGALYSTAQELGQVLAHRMYGYIMEMFVFGPKCTHSHIRRCWISIR